MGIVHPPLGYPPASGGVETYVQELVTRTRYETGAAGVLQTSNPNRFDVRVLTSRLRTHGPMSELAPEQLLDDPMHVQRLHHAATPLVSYPRLQALKYYLGHHQPDIIHGHGFWYQPADVSARYARRHRRPFVFNPYFYAHGPRQKLIWQLYRSTIGRATFAAADAVIVISPFEQKLIESAGLPVNRFVLIPPGIDTAVFNQPRPNPFQARGLAGEIALAVSRLAESKGLSSLLRALPSVLKKHPNLQLVIIGDDFGAKKKLQQQAVALGITNYIHFWGHLEREQLLAAYQHADIFIHPSYYEAFGITVAEAFAARTPVIARNTSAIPFVAPPHTTSLLFNDDSELPETMTTLLSNATLRRTLGEQGHQHVKKNFSWEKSIATLTSLYHELYAQR